MGEMKGLCPLVMAVEDQDLDRLLISRALKQWFPDHTLIVAKSAFDAFGFLEDAEVRDRLALVLLDLRCPGVHPLQVLSTMKADPELQSVPVVVFSSSEDDEELRHAAELRANAIVKKPLDFYEYQQSIKAVFELWLGGLATAPAIEKSEDILPIFTLEKMTDKGLFQMAKVSEGYESGGIFMRLWIGDEIADHEECTVSDLKIAIHELSSKVGSRTRRLGSVELTRTDFNDEIRWAFDDRPNSYFFVHVQTSEIEQVLESAPADVVLL